MEIPEEHELISFFESEPSRLDSNIPFHYTISTFQVQNQNETIVISISPSYGDLDISVKQSNSLKLEWNFHQLKSIAIEKKDGDERLWITFKEENMSDCFLWVKPEFKMIGGMNIIH